MQTYIYEKTIEELEKTAKILLETGKIKSIGETIKIVDNIRPAHPNGRTRYRIECYT